MVVNWNTSGPDYQLGRIELESVHAAAVDCKVAATGFFVVKTKPPSSSLHFVPRATKAAATSEVPCMGPTKAVYWKQPPVEGNALVVFFVVHFISNFSNPILLPIRRSSVTAPIAKTKTLLL